MPQNRRLACQTVREHLIQTPGLHPMTSSGVRCATAYLEHGIHAAAIVHKLLADFGRAAPLPGLQITVHARYDEAVQAPPDSLLVRTDPDAQLPQAVGLPERHLFNFTGAGRSGFHYDALC